jgi:hypothetical protein
MTFYIVSFCGSLGHSNVPPSFFFFFFWGEVAKVEIIHKPIQPNLAIIYIYMLIYFWPPTWTTLEIWCFLRIFLAPILVVFFQKNHWICVTHHYKNPAPFHPKPGLTTSSRSTKRWVTNVEEAISLLQ